MPEAPERASPRVRAALWVVRDGRVLMAQHEKRGETYFLLPGGGVDPGEGWDQAAARELEEELGVVARPGRLRAVFENQSPDGRRHILHAIFDGEVDGEPAATGEDPRVVGCRWIDRAELATLAVFPQVGSRFDQWLDPAGPEAPGAEYARVAWV